MLHLIKTDSLLHFANAWLLKNDTLSWSRLRAVCLMQTGRPHVFKRYYDEAIVHYCVVISSVFMEICSQEKLELCCTKNKREILYENFCGAFQGSVGADPLVEEMKSVVCEQGLRPHLPLVWQQNATLRDLFNIMTECWYATPSDRLSAMRIKKDLSIQRQMLGPPLLIAPDQLPYHLPPQSLLVGEVEGSVASLPPGMFYYRSPPHNNQGENITYAPTDITDSSPVTAHSATHLVAGNVQPPNIVANFANC